MERLNRIIKSAEFEEIIEGIAHYEQKREFCSHTMEHFFAVARICYILVLEEYTLSGLFEKGLSKELIYTAGILHDIGRLEEYKTGVDHAAVGAKTAQKFLEKNGYSETEIELVTAAVSEHRELPNKPTYLGGKLFEADKMSRSCYSCAAAEKCYNREIKERSDMLYY